MTLQSQLLVSSRAHSSSKPFTISQIKVAFGGNLRNFSIRHEPSQASHASSASGLMSIYRVPLQAVSQGASSVPPNLTNARTGQLGDEMIGSADLTIVPGGSKAFSIDHIPRDAGDVDVSNLTLCLYESDFDLEIVITEDEEMHQKVFWSPSETGLTMKTLKSEHSSTVKILPKPPKLRIETRDIPLSYYTDEAILVDLWVVNEEEEEVVVTLEARTVGLKEPPPRLTWESPPEDDRKHVATDESTDEKGETSVSKAIGNLMSCSEQKHPIGLQALSEATNYVLEVRARYYLISDPETQLSKFFSTSFAIKSPFEASYSFTPKIHSEPWPNYFNVVEGHEEGEGNEGRKEGLAKGLIQEWLLTSRLYSLASESLTVEHVYLRVLEIHEAAICEVHQSTLDASKLGAIAPNDSQERDFLLQTQKLDLEDRRSTYLDLRLEVLWSRKDSHGSRTKTCLAVPELAIPFGEPRVLVTSSSGEVPPGIIHLEYVIENPSTYVLSFNLAMDSSEEFAFSGPKNVSVELLPVSRQVIPYNLMPLVKGTWINPQFRVFDTQFHKALKVNAAEGVRSDKKGLSIWVDADD